MKTEDGCVWACSTEGPDVGCANLGPRGKVAEIMSQWLGSIDDCETPDRYERSKPRLDPRLQVLDHRLDAITSI